MNRTRPSTRYGTAGLTLAAFSASLRDQTNLDQLTAHLTDVVDETIRPSSVALWLNSQAASSAPARKPDGL